MSVCVCDLYGPDNCGCLPGRLTNRVYMEWEPADARQILDAIAALAPLEMRRCAVGCEGLHDHTTRRRTCGT